MSKLLKQNMLRRKINDGVKIKTAFINHDISKWKEKSLYFEIKADPFFENPVVIVINDTGIADDVRYQKYKFALNYFNESGYQAVEGYSSDRYPRVDLYEQFDIIFISDINMTQFSGGHSFELACEMSLGCYLPYGMHLSGNSGYHFNLSRFEKLWRWFFESQEILDLKKSFTNQLFGNERVVGYINFDQYLFEDKQENEHKQNECGIIYAPHWTNGDEWDFEFGTFNWSAPVVLDLMVSNPQDYFWYRPHPLLDISVREQWPQSKKIDREWYFYFIDEISRLSNVRTIIGPEYIHCFKMSRALITDSVSFLGEYLPAQKPVVALMQDKSSYNKFGKQIVDSYYIARNPTELYSAYENVIKLGNDPMASEREMRLNYLFLNDKSTVASKIIRSITVF